MRAHAFVRILRGASRACQRPVEAYQTWSYRICPECAFYLRPLARVCVSCVLCVMPPGHAEEIKQPFEARRAAAPQPRGQLWEDQVPARP